MTSSRYFKTKEHREKTGETLKEYFKSAKGLKDKKELSKLAKKRIREKNHNWRGGRMVGRDGYVRILCKDHPYVNNSGYIFEHRLVMEKTIGRHLKPSERVHHIDRNRKNNKPSNLLLCKDISEHAKITFNPKHISRKEKFYIFFIIYLLNQLNTNR